MKFIYLLIVIVCFFFTTNASAQLVERRDSVVTKTILKPIREVSPKKAAMLSAVFPGLGQIYNRKYWKLPIVYGGIGGMIYGLSWNNNTYLDYRNAFIDWTFKLKGIPNNERYRNVVPKGFDFSVYDSGGEEWFLKQLENKKDSYRRSRDLMIFGVVVVYLINILDASVDAHLSNFDVGEDLSMEISPVLMGASNDGNKSLGFACRFNF